MQPKVAAFFGGVLTLGVCTQAMAQVEAPQTVSWFGHFLWTDDALGNLIIWLLLAMSGASIGFAMRLLLTYQKKKMLPQGTKKRIFDALAERQYREAIEISDQSPSLMCKIISSALHESPNGYVAMERAIEESSESETLKALRPLEYLNVLGNIAPMIGLFGTVYGMIHAFQQLVAHGGNAEPAQLAAGISTALITTFWGLIVAVPALTCYALIRNKVDSVASESVKIAEEMIRPFKPSLAALQQARAQQIQQARAQQAAVIQAQVRAQAAQASGSFAAMGQTPPQGMAEAAPMTQTQPVQSTPEQVQSQTEDDAENLLDREISGNAVMEALGNLQSVKEEEEKKDALSVAGEGDEAGEGMDDTDIAESFELDDEDEPLAMPEEGTSGHEQTHGVSNRDLSQDGKAYFMTPSENVPPPLSGGYVQAASDKQVAITPAHEDPYELATPDGLGTNIAAQANNGLSAEQIAQIQQMAQQMAAQMAAQIVQQNNSGQSE